jgi:hypothetical protein
MSRLRHEESLLERVSASMSQVKIPMILPPFLTGGKTFPIKTLGSFAFSSAEDWIGEWPFGWWLENGAAIASSVCMDVSEYDRTA